MKRLFKLLVVVTLALTLLIGVIPASTAETQVQQVRIWTNDGTLQDLYNDAIAEYNATTGKEKGIEIVYQVFGGDYNDVLKVALAAGQGPEIYKFVGTVKDPFVDSGWMVALEDLPGSEALLEKWAPVIVPGYNTYKGKTYSLPVKALNTKFIYNKTLLEKNGFAEPPKTWDELVKMAKVITDNGEGEEYGYGVHLQNAGSSGKWYLATQFAASVGHMGYDFTKGEYRFKDFAPILSYFQQMRKDGSIFPGYEALSQDGLAAHFAAGRVAMMAGVGWDVSTLNRSFDIQDEWGVFQTPVLDVNNSYKAYSQIGDLLCVGPAALSMPEKVLEVYSFAHNDDLLLQMHQQGLEFVGLQSIQKAVTNPPDMVGWKEFADTSKNYFTMTPPDGLLTLEGQTYQNVLCNAITVDMTDQEIMDLLTDMDNRYNTALKNAEKAGADMSAFINPDWDTRLK